MLVDDSLVVRSILERIVEQRPELKICASVASAREALAYLACEPVDVVVLDTEMTGMNGIDALPHIIERAHNARVLILSSTCVEGGPVEIEEIGRAPCKERAVEEASTSAVGVLLKKNQSSTLTTTT